MRCEKRRVVWGFLVVSLLVAVGCREENPEGTPPSAPPAQTQTPPAAPAQGQAQPQAPTQVQPQAPAQVQAAGVELDKSVSEIQAQAQAMSVDNLKATALKYKEAILAKQAELEKLAAKVKEIPLAQALGDEAKTLKTDLAAVETSLKALKERFQVYYSALKEKGADLSALAL